MTSLKLTAAALLQTQEGLSGQDQKKGKMEEEEVTSDSSRVVYVARHNRMSFQA